MKNIFRMVVEIVAKDKATATVDKTTKSIKASGKAAGAAADSFKSLAGAYTALIVAGRVKGAIEAIIVPARKMETSMMRLGWLTGKASAELQVMRSVAEDVAKTTVFGPQEAVDAMGQLVRATGSAEVAMGALGTTAGLAMGSFGRLTLEKSTKMVTDMAKAFGMSGNDIGAAGDKVMAVTKAMGVGVEELKDVMGYLGTAATRGGQSFEQMLQSFALARRVLPSSRRAATQLMRVMGELTSVKAQDAMSKIGISLSDATGRTRDLSDIMMDLSEAATVAPLAARDALNAAFGQASVKPMIAMLGQLQNGMHSASGEVLYGADVFRYLRRTINESGGAVKEANDLYMKTADAGIQRMDEAWLLLKTTLGDAILPTLGKLAKSMADILSMVSTALRELSPLTKWFLKFGMLSVAGGAALIALRMAWVGVSAIWKAATTHAYGLAKSQTAVATTTKTAGFAAKMASIQHNWLSTSLRNMSASASLAGWKISGMTMRMRISTGASRMLAVGLRGASWAMKSLWGLISANPIGILLIAIPALIDALRYLGDWFDKKIQESGQKRAMASIGTDPKMQKIWGMKDSKKAIAAWDKHRKKQESKYKVAWDAGMLMGTKAELAAMDDAFKKRFGFLQKMEGLKDKLQKRRNEYELRYAHRINNVLKMGSKPFEDAVDKLTDMFKYKPAVIKASSITKISNKLQAVAKAKPGQVIAGSQVTAAEIEAAQRLSGTEGIGGFVDVIKKSVSGKKLTGTDVMGAVGKMKSAHALLQAIYGAKQGVGVNKLFEDTAGAMLKQLSPAARAEAMGYARTTRGHGVTGQPLGGFSAGAGAFAPGGDVGFAQIQRRIQNLSPYMSHWMGGRGGLAEAGSSVSTAAQHGRGEQFKGDYFPMSGPMSTMEGGTPLSPDELSQRVKPEEERKVDAVKVEITKLKDAMKTLNDTVRTLNSEGLKVKPDGDPGETGGLNSVGGLFSFG